MLSAVLPPLATSLKLLIGVGKGNVTQSNKPNEQRLAEAHAAPIGEGGYRRIQFSHVGTTLSGALSVVDVPDEKTLATASLKTIQLWDVSTLQKLKTDDLIKTACSHLIWNFSESTWGVMFGDQPYHKLCEQLPGP